MFSLIARTGSLLQFCQHLNTCCFVGNLRLQEMMAVMCKERGARIFATDERSERSPSFRMSLLKSSQCCGCKSLHVISCLQVLHRQWSDDCTGWLGNVPLGSRHRAVRLLDYTKVNNFTNNHQIHQYHTYLVDKTFCFVHVFCFP